MAGYKEWIENAEVKIDYFSAFLKADRKSTRLNSSH